MSKIVYLYVKTSLSLLLPINCNDDQNYVCQLSTTFIHHTFSMWAHYSPWDPYDLFTSFYSFSFLSRSKQDNQALDSTLIFIIYNSRTRLHKRIIRQNSKLKLYSTRSRYYQKDRTKKNGKDKSDGDTIPGHSPKLGSCQGECPYQILNSSSLVETVVILLMA